MTRVRLGEDLLYLTRADVVQLAMTDAEVVELTRQALGEHARGRTAMPAKIAIHPRPEAFLHAMPAHVPAARACGQKWIACFPENVSRGLPQTTGVLVLNDEATGVPAAIMDATWITGRRTPAVSALASEALAPAASRRLAIIGCGVQGRAHAELMSEALPGLDEVRLYDVRPGIAAAAVAELSAAAPRPDVAFRAVNDPETAVRGADIVVTATIIRPEPAPIVRDEWLADRCLALPVDLDSAWEWKSWARADRFLVDSLDEMRYFEGQGYLANGLPPLHAETGAVLAGLAAGREPDDRLIVCVNIGMAVVDVVIGLALYERALERGIGRLLPQ
jgi:ornithine cyclodeaminase/alanine dehydrogenase-like protein (mu-crystallin family)